MQGLLLFVRIGEIAHQRIDLPPFTFGGTPHTTVALPFGTIRIRAKGSDGGHNGLKNIAELLGTNAYARLRFGIGGDFPKGMQIDYVLGEWTKEEATALPERTKVAAEAIKAFGTIGLERTMNQFNNS